MNPDDLMVGPFAESQKNVSDIAGNFFFSKVFYDSIMKHKEIENEYVDAITNNESIDIINNLKMSYQASEYSLNIAFQVMSESLYEA